MLMKYRHHLNVVRDCIDKNQIVIKLMLNNNVLEGETEEEPPHHQSHYNQHKPKLHNLNGHQHHRKQSSVPLDCTGIRSNSILDAPSDKNLHPLRIRPQDMEHVSFITII